MAPEQVRGQNADARTDLFALGVVLYEMLTGERAFSGASFVETGNAILNDEPDLDSASGRELPAAVRRTVAHCIEKSPEQRFRSARDLAFHMESLLGSDPGRGSSAAPATSRRIPQRSFAPILLGVLLVGLAAGALVARRMGGGAALQTVHFQLLPPPGGSFQFDLEECKSFAISPDGRSIAFVANDSSGNRRAWLRDVGEGEAKGLAGTEGANSLFWSPDGRSLGFFVRRALRRYDIGPAGVVGVCALMDDGLNAGSWGRDGTILFAGIEQGTIYRVPAAGGAPREVLHPNETAGQIELAWPEFLPDGRRFFYFVRRRDHRDSLMLGDLVGTSRPVMELSSRVQLADPRTLLFVRDGTLIRQSFDEAAGRPTGTPAPVAQGISYFSSTGGALFAASAGGAVAYQRATDRCRLALVDERGDEHARVGAPADYLGGMDLSADGRRLLCSRRRASTGTWDIWQMDIARGSESRLTDADPITEAMPLWLPGEESITFMSTRGGGSPKLRRRALVSGAEAALLPGGGFQTGQDVSPDGRWLLYTERRPAQMEHLWILPLGGGEPRRLTAASSREGSGVISPDARFAAILADEGERYELCLVPFPGPGQRVRVSTHGAVDARWSHDGSRLFYLTPDGHMMAVSVRTSPSLQVGEPRALFQTGARQWKDFLVTPGGEFLAMVPEVVQAEEPVDVVVGWKQGNANR